MLPLAVALATTFLLAGCMPGEPIITPVPEPSSTPIFASDEEALAAATEAYAKYVEVSDLIASEGGSSPERIAPLVSKDRFKEELEAYKQLDASGNHQEGRSKFDGAILQQLIDSGSDEASIIFYVCLDQSQAKFIDGDGTDITPVDTSRRSAFEITMSATNARELVLILEGMERWSGSGVC